MNESKAYRHPIIPLLKIWPGSQRNRIMRSTIALYLTTSFFLLAGGSSGADPAYTIENAVNSFDEEKVVPTDVGYQYWFADTDFADGKTLKLSVVRPNAATHAPHTHEEDEFFFVLEGTAEFYLDGETRTGGPMTSFYCPSGSAHGIRNAGDTELKYLVIKKYILDD